MNTGYLTTVYLYIPVHTLDEALMMSIGSYINHAYTPALVSHAHSTICSKQYKNLIKKLYVAIRSFGTAPLVDRNVCIALVSSPIPWFLRVL